MKIKRYFAPDMRQAIRQVRDEQGPDAVILSNRKVDGGIELIAAVDYDEEALRQSTPPASPSPSPLKSNASLAAADFLAGLKSNSQQTSTVIKSKSAPFLAQEKMTSQPKAIKPAYAKPVEWMQDPGMQAMRQELKELRSLLEGQVSQLAWGDLSRRKPVQLAVIQHLMGMGFTSEICSSIADQIPPHLDRDEACRLSLKMIEKLIPITNDDILNNGGIVALVGPTGVGKTTSIAKLAARFALRHGHNHVALVTTDSYRIGAQEQLFTFGRILGVPVHVASNAQELEAVLKSLCDKKLVLVDTAGMSQRDLRLAEHFSELRKSVFAVKTYLVLSAQAQMYSLEEAVRSFSKANLAGCIFTKLDEAVCIGGLLSVVCKHQIPIAYSSEGQRVPEDIQPARSAALVEKAVEIVKKANFDTDNGLLPINFGGYSANAYV